MKFSFAMVISVFLSYSSTVAAKDAVETSVTIKPVLKSGGELLDASSGIAFYAENSAGSWTYADRSNQLLLAEAGTYIVGGEYVSGFCYSNTTEVTTNSSIKSIVLSLKIVCE